jgi:hypothetical protein
LGFSAIGGKKQSHSSDLIGAGVTGCQAPGLKTPKYGSAAQVVVEKNVRIPQRLFDKHYVCILWQNFSKKAIGRGHFGKFKR